ncbi:hypothetical protein PanWU01x14_221530 [Parasponia andersonii]|uniref:RNA helicase n=1 Tax=Parasponia andersonii TaxID=3476 RepID=A0A2P5BPD1_PARAD|nr:hypothetical protein PanWU01x14_221530 [Parasponia andersonii]
MEVSTVAMEAEKASGGGLYAPGKDRVVFRPPERKSLLGKWLRLMVALKPQEKEFVSVAASMEEKENYGSSVMDDTGSNNTFAGIAASETPHKGFKVTMNKPSSSSSFLASLSGPVSTISAQSSQSFRSRSPREDCGNERREYKDHHDRDDRIGGRRDYKDDNRGRADNRRGMVEIMEEREVEMKVQRGGLDEEAEGTGLAKEQKYKISESMHLEMEYNSDRAWYDREEGNTMFDADSSSFFFGDEASFQKKEAELAKRLVRRDGTKMTLTQSKKMSQRTADNAQWEDRQLLRSGAVCGTEVQTEFDDEEERKVILFVHDTKPPFLDGRVVFTKQAEPIMPIKDPTSDMAIISRKGSALVKEIHEKQSTNKSRQCFWELAGSKLGDILGVEKTAGQIDADTAAVGEDGEIDFKEEAKFAQHLKKGEAVICENQVVVIVGETGSGKTTQLTQYLHEDGYTVNGIVGCTQPRRVAAMSVAKRVSEEIETELGDKVGYAIHFEDVTGPNTIIKYITDGVLLRETLKDADLEKYRVAQRRDFELIVTSVTLNAQKFSKFFGGVPIHVIPGRTFAVNILYSKSPCEDYVEAAMKQAMTVHITSPPGDILIFMAGQDEIEAACYALAERMELLVSTTKKGVPKLLILLIFSQLPADLQAKVFEKAEEGECKCIVATNIAETSLTVDGIFYALTLVTVK